MRTSIAVLALALIVSGCAADEGSDVSQTTAAPTTAAPTTAAPTTAAPTTAAPTTTPPTTESPTSTAASGSIQLVVTTSDLGDILTDGEGRTLYLFVPDGQGESTCYDGCASAWPPLEGEVTAGDGIDPALMGSIERTDGSSQATYNDWPLYYFSGDNGPGDTNGQGINEIWYVVDPGGNAVQ